MNKYSIPENLAISDSGFMFLASTGETFTMNETGREVFKLIQAGLSPEEISSRITEIYEIDANSLMRDMDDFIYQLKNYNLLSEL